MNKIKYFINDVKNFMRFKADIKNELNDPNSNLSAFNVKQNWLGNILYFQTSLPNEFDYVDTNMTEEIRIHKLMDQIEPVNYVLDTKLNWGEYLVQQINPLVENDDDDYPSLTYGIVYIFIPPYLTITNVIKYLLLLVLLGLLLVGLIGMAFGHDVYNLGDYFAYVKNTLFLDAPAL